MSSPPPTRARPASRPACLRCSPPRAWPVPGYWPRGPAAGAAIRSRKKVRSSDPRRSGPPPMPPRSSRASLRSSALPAPPAGRPPGRRPPGRRPPACFPKAPRRSAMPARPCSSAWSQRSPTRKTRSSRASAACAVLACSWPSANTAGVRPPARHSTGVPIVAPRGRVLKPRRPYLIRPDDPAGRSRGRRLRKGPPFPYPAAISGLCIRLPIAARR